jgi:secondary thiamine-phosphate synthase enzyme
MGVTRRPGGHDAGATPRYVKLMTTKATTGRPAQVGQIGQAFETLSVETRGPGLSDQTSAVRAWLDRIGAGDGLLTLFIRHTSASLLIQENADPDVHEDLLDALERLAPRDHAYAHDVEGPDDMPAHIKSALTATSLSIPVKAGRMLLGTWQGIYLVEHRDRPHRREVVLHYLGTLGG